MPPIRAHTVPFPHYPAVLFHAREIACPRLSAMLVLSKFDDVAVQSREPSAFCYGLPLTFIPDLLNEGRLQYLPSSVICRQAKVSLNSERSKKCKFGLGF